MNRDNIENIRRISIRIGKRQLSEFSKYELRND